MSTLLIIVGIALVAFATWLLRRRARALHFRQLAGMPLDAELVDLLRQHMPLYERMPSQLQLRLQGLVNVFLNDKSFFGSGGLEITDEMRLAVAGNACLLLLNQDAPRFPGSSTILLYPNTIVTQTVKHDGPIVREGQSARLGESWPRDFVVGRCAARSRQPRRRAQRRDPRVRPQTRRGPANLLAGNSGDSLLICKHRSYDTG
jgi:Mlc titration factor MtfA (ptsG expression regulator)